MTTLILVGTGAFAFFALWLAIWLSPREKFPARGIDPMYYSARTRANTVR